jgi:hypothetical protein
LHRLRYLATPPGAIGVLLAVVLLFAVSCTRGDDAPEGAEGTPAETAAATTAPSPTASATAAAEESNSEPVMIVAEAGDVAARLDIPAGALPAGVDASQISVRPFDPAARGLDAGEGQIVAAFDLQPDGLAFSEPVLLTYDIPFEGGGLYMVMLAGSSGDLEVLEIADAIIDASGTRLTITVPVSHFSRTWVLSFTDVQVDLLSEFTGEYLVGESFTVRMRVFRPRVSEDRSGPVYTGEGVVHIGDRREPTVWSIVYGWRSGPPRPLDLLGEAFFADPPEWQEGPLEPDVVPGGGDLLTIKLEPERSFVDVSQAFTCEEAGPFILDVSGSLEFPIRVTRLFPDGRQETTDEVGHPLFLHRLVGRCIVSAPPPEVTAIAPPSSPTAIAVPPTGETEETETEEEPPGDESGTGSTSSVLVEGNGVTMTASVPDEVTAGQTYQVQVSIKGADGQPLSGEVSCTLVKRGDPEGTHFTVTLSSDGTATLTLEIPWKSGDEVALFCFFEELGEDARFITSFFLQ